MASQNFEVIHSELGYQWIDQDRIESFSPGDDFLQKYNMNTLITILLLTKLNSVMLRASMPHHHLSVIVIHRQDIHVPMHP